MKWLNKLKGVEHANPTEETQGIRQEPPEPVPPLEPQWEPGQLVREVDGRLQARAETRAEAKLTIKELKLRKRELQLGRRQLTQEMQAARAEYRGKVAGRHNLTGLGRGGVGRAVRIGVQAGRRADRMGHDRTLAGLEAQRNAYDAQINDLDRLILTMEQYSRGDQD